MSSRSAGKGRALLGVVIKDVAKIRDYYEQHPQREVEAVQDALEHWVEEKDPTWNDLLPAVTDKIGAMDCNKLKEKLQSKTGDTLQLESRNHLLDYPVLSCNDASA